MSVERESESRSDDAALVELVRCDYDATLRVLDGVVTTGNQVRAIGIAAWGVIFGLSVRDDSLVLIVVAVGLLVVFAATDAYHAALYRRARSRAMSLEHLLDGWIDRLGIDSDDDDAVLRQRARLQTHRFGVYAALKRPTWRDLLRAPPVLVFRIVYPALLIASVVTAALFA